MAQQRAFAAAAAAHNDKDVAFIDREIQVVMDHEVAIGHRQILDDDVRLPHRIALRIAQYGRLGRGHRTHIFSVVQITVAVASMTMISTMHRTTAEVAAAPTAAALR